MRNDQSISLTLNFDFAYVTLFTSTDYGLAHSLSIYIVLYLKRNDEQSATERLNIFSKIRPNDQCFKRDRGTDRLHRIWIKVIRHSWKQRDLTFASQISFKVWYRKLKFWFLLRSSLCSLSTFKLVCNSVFYPDSRRFRKWSEELRTRRSGALDRYCRRES